MSNDLVLTAPEPIREESPMGLLSLALKNNAAIDVIERLAALQEKALAREADIDFSEALNRVQDKIKRIAPDLENPQKRSKYASYAAIDRVIRPLYGPEGFSLSFTHADCPKPDHIRVICWVRLRAHKEPYQVDWPVDTKGPKGEPVMTATQATGASDSYAKRYLVKDIFNIAIGELDNDGNSPLTNEWLADQVGEIQRCETIEGLRTAFQTASTVALDAKDMNAYTVLKQAKDKKRQELS
jgi:hypothetical protein